MGLGFWGHLKALEVTDVYRYLTPVYSYGLCSYGLYGYGFI